MRFGQEEQQEEMRAERAEEAQASSEGEMRSVGRTRPAGKAKEWVPEERVSMKAKEEDLAAKENSKRRGRKRRNGSEWRQTWEQVAHNPRPRQTWERKRRRKVSKSAVKKRKRF